jgi:hypothetical protein
MGSIPRAQIERSHGAGESWLLDQHADLSTQISPGWLILRLNLLPLIAREETSQTIFSQVKRAVELIALNSFGCFGRSLAKLG